MVRRRSKRLQDAIVSEKKKQARPDSDEVVAEDSEISDIKTFDVVDPTTNEKLTVSPEVNSILYGNSSPDSSKASIPWSPDLKDNPQLPDPLEPSITLNPDAVSAVDHILKETEALLSNLSPPAASTFEKTVHVTVQQQEISQKIVQTVPPPMDVRISGSSPFRGQDQAVFNRNYDKINPAEFTPPMTKFKTSFATNPQATNQVLLSTLGLFQHGNQPPAITAGTWPNTSLPPLINVPSSPYLPSPIKLPDSPIQPPPPPPALGGTAYFQPLVGENVGGERLVPDAETAALNYVQQPLNQPSTSQQPLADPASSPPPAQPLPEAAQRGADQLFAQQLANEEAARALAAQRNKSMANVGNAKLLNMTSDDPRYWQYKLSKIRAEAFGKNLKFQSFLRMRNAVRIQRRCLGYARINSQKKHLTCRVYEHRVENDYMANHLSAHAVGTIEQYPQNVYKYVSGLDAPYKKAIVPDRYIVQDGKLVLNPRFGDLMEVA